MPSSQSDSDNPSVAKLQTAKKHSLLLVTIGDNHILIIFSFIIDNYQNNRGKLPLYVLLCLIIAKTTSNYLNNRASSLTLILVTIGDRTTHGAGNMQIEKLWDSKK